VETYSIRRLWYERRKDDELFLHESIGEREVLKIKVTVYEIVIKFLL